MVFLEKYNSFTDEDCLLELEDHGMYHVLLNSIPKDFQIGLLHKGESQLKQHFDKGRDLKYEWEVKMGSKGLEVFVEQQRMACIDKDVVRIENIELMFHLNEKWLVVYNGLTKETKARVDWRRNFSQIDLHMHASEAPGMKVYFHEPMPFWHHESMFDDEIPVGEKRPREPVY